MSSESVLLLNCEECRKVLGTADVVEQICGHWWAGIGSQPFDLPSEDLMNTDPWFDRFALHNERSPQEVQKDVESLMYDQKSGRRSGQRSHQVLWQFVTPLEATLRTQPKKIPPLGIFIPSFSQSFWNKDQIGRLFPYFLKEQYALSPLPRTARIESTEYLTIAFTFPRRRSALQIPFAQTFSTEETTNIINFCALACRLGPSARSRLENGFLTKQQLVNLRNGIAQMIQTYFSSEADRSVPRAVAPAPEKQGKKITFRWTDVTEKAKEMTQEEGRSLIVEIAQPVNRDSGELVVRHHGVSKQYTVLPESSQRRIEFRKMGADVRNQWKTQLARFTRSQTLSPEDGELVSRVLKTFLWSVDQMAESVLLFRHHRTAGWEAIRVSSAVWLLSRLKARSNFWLPMAKAMHEYKDYRLVIWDADETNPVWRPLEFKKRVSAPRPSQEEFASKMLCPKLWDRFSPLFSKEAVNALLVKRDLTRRSLVRRTPFDRVEYYQVKLDNSSIKKARAAWSKLASKSESFAQVLPHFLGAWVFSMQHLVNAYFVHPDTPTCAWSSVAWHWLKAWDQKDAKQMNYCEVLLKKPPRILFYEKNRYSVVSAAEDYLDDAREWWMGFLTTYFSERIPKAQLDKASVLALEFMPFPSTISYPRKGFQIEVDGKEQFFALSSSRNVPKKKLFDRVDMDLLRRVYTIFGYYDLEDNTLLPDEELGTRICICYAWDARVFLKFTWKGLRLVLDVQRLVHALVSLVSLADEPSSDLSSLALRKQIQNQPIIVVEWRQVGTRNTIYTYSQS